MPTLCASRFRTGNDGLPHGRSSGQLQVPHEHDRGGEADTAGWTAAPAALNRWGTRRVPVEVDTRGLAKRAHCRSGTSMAYHTRLALGAACKRLLPRRGGWLMAAGLAAAAGFALSVTGGAAADCPAILNVTSLYARTVAEVVCLWNRARFLRSPFSRTCLGVSGSSLRVFAGTLPTSGFLCHHGALTHCAARVFWFCLPPRPMCVSPLSLGPRLAGRRRRAVPRKCVAVQLGHPHPYLWRL